VGLTGTLWQKRNPAIAGIEPLPPTFIGKYQCYGTPGCNVLVRVYANIHTKILLCKIFLEKFMIANFVNKFCAFERPLPCSRSSATASCYASVEFSTHSYFSGIHVVIQGHYIIW